MEAIGVRTIIIGSLVLTILLLYSYSEGGFYERIYYPTRKTPFRTHDVTYLSPDRLVYNRVPKCGTMTAVGIINVLSTRNNFTVISSPIYDHAELKTEGEQRELVEKVLSYQPPVLYHRHVKFFDFGKYTSKDNIPLFINIIREPFERLVSAFYYLNVNKSRNLIVGNFDDCVKQQHPQCVSEFMLGYSMGFFCGQERFCRSQSQRSLKTAKRNIERHYTVVGLTEDMEATFKLLGWTIPSFFQGSSFVYKATSKLWMNTGVNDKPYTEETRQQLLPRMAKEYNLYHWIKSRFYRQIRQMKL